MGVAASQRKNLKPVEVVHANKDQEYINTESIFNNIINNQVIEKFEEIQDTVVPMLEETEDIRMTRQYEGNLFPKIKKRQVHIQFDFQYAYILGQGSYGQVYSCLDKYTGEKLAIKTFIPTQDNIDSVLWEASIIAFLKNPNIIKIFDYNEGRENNVNQKTFDNLTSQNLNNQPYIVLEQVPFSLHDMCKQFNGFPEAMCALFMFQIVRSVQFCHNNNIAHLDIKLGNIMLDSKFKPILMDFGTSVRANEPMAFGVRGSPSWLAPEVLKQQKYDPFKADVWSLGCTLIELLDGRPPYSYLAQVPAILYHVSQLEEPPKPNTYISQNCIRFLAKCLVLDPEKRSNINDLIADPFLANVALQLENIGNKQDITPIYVDLQILQEKNKLAQEASSENTQTSEMFQEEESATPKSQDEQHKERPDELQKLCIEEPDFESAWPSDEDLKLTHDQIFEQQELQIV